jgi:hypothetical protein
MNSPKNLYWRILARVTIKQAIVSLVESHRAEPVLMEKRETIASYTEDCGALSPVLIHRYNVLWDFEGLADVHNRVFLIVIECLGNAYPFVSGDLDRPPCTDFTLYGWGLAVIASRG